MTRAVTGCSGAPAGTAGVSRRSEALAVAAALLAAAVLAAALPRPAGAGPRAAAAPAGAYIVRFDAATPPAQRRALVASAGATVTRDLHIIDGVGVRADAGAAARIAALAGVGSVSAVRPIASRGAPEPERLRTVYGPTIGAQDVRADGITGRGVAVAVVDTGIDGDLPDFGGARDARSRVREVVVNPDATDAGDEYGHGTHVAGIIAGDGGSRRRTDPARGAYVGVAPAARLVSIKIADDEGDASNLDAIAGLQFAVDHAERYGIRVVNLSLASAVAESPATDPLAAAAEAAWRHGLVVVAAAGNDGDARDAVSYAPGNDPFVITVGATDDQGTADPADDELAPWSSRGKTQLGMVKPDVLAPGTGIVSTLARESAFAQLCPECVTDHGYFRASGTSMATAVTSGAAALVLQAHPDWTPDQVKQALTATGTLRVDEAIAATPDDTPQPWDPNELVDPQSGKVDYTAASWRAASWRAASWRVRLKPAR